MTGFLIQFDYPEGGTFWAGTYKDSIGWAPSAASAIVFDTAGAAQLMLDNGYGPHTRPFGKVVPA